MQKQEVERILAKLLTKYLVYAPIRIGDIIRVGKIEQPTELDWSGDLPINSFKSIFLPPQETLFEQTGRSLDSSSRWNDPKNHGRSVVAWGMNILDLQASTLLEHVFEKDVYYQKRRRNIYVVGFTAGLPDDFRKYKVFHQSYEEDVLEHVLFDVFIERKKDGNFIFFSGSQKGQKLLEEVGIDDYQNIEFAGLVPEAGLNPRLLTNRKAVAENPDSKTWDELAEICLACGKCSIICPTCYCFDALDEPELNGVSKKRQWSSCFYPEFSKTAGGFKELDSVKKRLYFWYYHKFVRIPDELSYYGCVSCMRCFRVCPVGINIAKNLQALNTKS